MSAVIDSDPAIEALGNGVTRRRICDDQITIYTVVGVGIKPTDAWVDGILDEIKEWDVTKPYLSLHDLSRSGTSPYGYQRTRSLFEQAPEGMIIRFVVVMPNTFIGKIMHSMAQMLLRANRNMNVQYYSCLTVEDGVRWLEGHIGTSL